MSAPGDGADAASPDARPRLLFLGPEGSFTHAAVESLHQTGSHLAAPADSVQDIIFGVESGRVEYGLVPIENSVEGHVPTTIDELVFNSSLCMIVQEVAVPVSFVLACEPLASLPDLRVVKSHPHGIAQCKQIIASMRLAVELSSSTSAACVEALADERTGVAAICSAKAASHYGLKIVKTQVEDTSGALTTMALLARRLSHPTGSDRSTVVLTPMDDHTGVLADALECFSRRSIALTAVSSRPLKSELGTYCFVVTARGHFADGVLGAALRAVTELGVRVKLLGSYPDIGDPAARKVVSAIPSGSVDAELYDEWREGLLGDPA